MIKNVKKLILLNLFSLNLHCDLMKIHEYFHEYATDQRHEEPANELLRKNPIKKKINCLMVPWQKIRTEILISKLGNLKLNGGFTVCAAASNLNSLVPFFKKIGIKTVFALNPTTRKFKNIKILPIAHYAINGVSPSENKDIFYSFIGSGTTHIVRSKIFEMNHPKNCIIIKRKRFHFFQAKELQETNRLEYQDVLSRSRFSLCPRGAGTSSYRFWESLQAGAIPVLISDDYLLPLNVNWSKCIVRIKEKDVSKVPEILSKISLKQELNMRSNCLKIYSLFSGDNLVKPIRDHYS